MRVTVSRKRDMKGAPDVGIRSSGTICVVIQMPSPEKYEKLTGLFERATGGTNKFLDACWDTKYLATTNLVQARNKFRRLVKQTLANKNNDIHSEGVYIAQLDNLFAIIETKQSDAELVNALKGLRATYLKSVLQPAVRSYLENTGKPALVVKKLYDNVAMMNGLLGIADFFKRIELP